MPYGAKFQEPVYTQWECVVLECSQFLERKRGFYNVALGVTKSEKSNSQRNKVASELYTLLAEPV